LAPAEHPNRKDSHGSRRFMAESPTSRLPATDPRSAPPSASVRVRRIRRRPKTSRRNTPQQNAPSASQLAALPARLCRNRADRGPTQIPLITLRFSRFPHGKKAVLSCTRTRRTPRIALHSIGWTARSRQSRRSIAEQSRKPRATRLPHRQQSPIGSRPAPQLGRRAYRTAYPGLTLLDYGNHQVLEYDFVLPRRQPQSSEWNIAVRSSRLSVSASRASIGFHQTVHHPLEKPVGDHIREGTPGKRLARTC